jgi:hypothetical protein
VSSADEMSKLSEQLHAIADQLSDLAMDQIRSALHAEGDSPSGEAAKLERELMRARRAVEKAAAILSSPRVRAVREDED